MRNELIPYLRVFLVPTLLLKAAIVYFGLNYSRFPDEGYGWGLFFAVLFSVVNFSLFLWKNWRDPSSEE